MKYVSFTCHRYQYSNGVTTLFSFYPDRKWDEDKLEIYEAIVKYPPDKYTWVYFDEEEQGFFTK